MKLSRRKFLSGSAVAAVVAATSKNLPLARGRSRLAKPAASGNPLRIPAVITGGNMAIANSVVPIFPSSDTAVYAINGSYPAPTIRIRKGESFSASVINSLSEDVVLHWHGLHVPSAVDGHPSQAIGAGKFANIAFTVINRAGTYFYHAHTDMKTAEQVYHGLAGFFIVDDDEEGALPLPRGEFDIPLALADRRVDPNEQFVYEPTDSDLMNGFVGEAILVNGTPDPYLTVKPTRYRFRILNASNARVYQLALDDSSQMVIVGSDGGILRAPVLTNSFYLSPGERAEVLIDFTDRAVGSSVTLKSLPFFADGTPYMPLPQGGEFDILRFDVAGSGDSQSQVPPTLTLFGLYDKTQAKRSREFDLGVDGMNHTINGQTFGIDRTDFTVPFGDLELWTFSNTFTTGLHPMHVHGTQFQVSSRTSGALQPTDQGWKDTVYVRGGESVDVLVKFADYEGRYLVHCHNLEHEDHGMMSNFEVKTIDDVKDEKGDQYSISASPNPANDHTIVRLPSQMTSNTLEICDANGRILQTHTIAHGVVSLKLMLGSLANGEYFIRCGSAVAKLSVLH